MCILELVDYNEAMLGKGEAAKTKSTRRKRTIRKKAEAAVTETPAQKAAETAVEESEQHSGDTDAEGSK
jgi:hypothetical protein